MLYSRKSILRKEATTGILIKLDVLNGLKSGYKWSESRENTSVVCKPTVNVKNKGKKWKRTQIKRKKKVDSSISQIAFLVQSHEWSLDKAHYAIY